MKETTHWVDTRLDDTQMWKLFFCLIVLPERPLELLLCGAGGGDVDGEQELLEVDVAVLVRVEGPEDRNRCVTHEGLFDNIFYAHNEESR